MPAPGAVRAGRAFLELFIDDERFRAGLADSERRLASFGKGLASIGTTLGAFGAAITGPLLLAAKQASDAQESFARFKNVFGASAADAERFATTLAKAMSASKGDVRASLASYQQFFRGLGFGREAALALSSQMSQLTIDFASFANASAADVSQAFVLGIRGSEKALEAYGIDVHDAAIEQEFLRQGMRLTVQQASQQQQALARVSIIARTLAERGAIGEAARNAGTFAARMQQLHSALSGVTTEIGKALLPTLSDLAAALTRGVANVQEFVAHNSQLVVALGWTGAGLAAAGTAFTGFGVAALFASTAIGALSKTIPILTVGVGALASVFGSVVTVAVLAAYKFGLFDAAAKQLLGTLGDFADSNAALRGVDKAQTFTRSTIDAELLRAQAEVELLRKGLGHDRQAQAAAVAAGESGSAIRGGEARVKAERDRLLAAQEYVQALRNQKRELEAQNNLTRAPRVGDVAGARLSKERSDAEAREIDALQTARARANLTGHRQKMELLRIEHQRQLEQARAAGQESLLIHQRQAAERRAENVEFAREEAARLERERESRRQKLRDLLEDRREAERNAQDVFERAAEAERTIRTSGTFTGSLAQQSLGASGTLGVDKQQLRELQQANARLDKINDGIRRIKNGIAVGAE